MAERPLELVISVTLDRDSVAPRLQVTLRGGGAGETVTRVECGVLAFDRARSILTVEGLKVDIETPPGPGAERT